MLGMKCLTPTFVAPEPEALGRSVSLPRLQGFGCLVARLNAKRKRRSTTSRVVLRTLPPGEQKCVVDVSHEMDISTYTACVCFRPMYSGAWPPSVFTTREP